MMPKYCSPLRYPGGKSKLYNIVKSILIENNLENQIYIEPYAGGAGLALMLLLNNDVKKIVINDADPAIYAFWHAVINNNDELCEFVKTVELSINEWNKQKYIYMNQANHNNIEIAKSLLYLNRTNRSGVIKAGVIGGKSQNGNYLMDARFNRKSIVSRLMAINKVADKIDLYNLDAIDFLNPSIMRKYYNVFINFDPPYVEKGAQLYQSYYSIAEHEELKKYIMKCRRKWILTYDNCNFTRKLYQNKRCSLIDINYSIASNRVAKELIVFSDSLKVPKTIELI